MIVKCEKGKHYYNKKRYTICPFCVEAEQTEKKKKQELKLSEQADKEMHVSQTLTL